MTNGSSVRTTLGSLAEWSHQLNLGQVFLDKGCAKLAGKCELTTLHHEIAPKLIIFNRIEHSGFSENATNTAPD